MDHSYQFSAAINLFDKGTLLIARGGMCLFVYYQVSIVGSDGIGNVDKPCFSVTTLVMRRDFGFSSTVERAGFFCGPP